MSKEEIKDVELEENCECEDEMIALEDLEKEDLIKYIEYLHEKMEKEIKIDTDKLQGSKIDVKSFKKGIEDASYYSGFYSTLISAGVSSSLAGDLVVSQQTILYNMKNNEAQKEISKINNVKIEQSQI